MTVIRSLKGVLLLNNPTYTPDSVPEDHKLKFEDWPLAGLHPSVREGFRQWYSRPLGFLIRKFGAKSVSQRVAIVQIVPWASRSFDLACVLPSAGTSSKNCKGSCSTRFDSDHRTKHSLLVRQARVKLGNIYKAVNVRNSSDIPIRSKDGGEGLDTLFSKALLG